jgi:hypothetical protein
MGFLEKIAVGSGPYPVGIGNKWFGTGHAPL